MAWLLQTHAERELKRAALHDALELRTRYGAEAEELCDLGLRSARDPRQRRLLKSIRAALQQTSA